MLDKRKRGNSQESDRIELKCDDSSEAKQTGAPLSNVVDSGVSHDHLAFLVSCDCVYEAQSTGCLVLPVFHPKDRYRRLDLRSIVQACRPPVGFPEFSRLGGLHAAKHFQRIRRQENQRHLPLP